MIASQRFQAELARRRAELLAPVEERLRSALEIGTSGNLSR